MAEGTRIGTITARSIPIIRPRTTPSTASPALARARTTHEQRLHRPFRRYRNNILISSTSSSATLAPSVGTGGALIRLSNLPDRDRGDDDRAVDRRNSSSSSMQELMVTVGGSESPGRLELEGARARGARCALSC